MRPARIVIVCCALALVPATARAQPGVFGGCPRGTVRAVADDQVTIEVARWTPAPDGPQLTTELRVCTPDVVRGGKARGEPSCVSTTEVPTGEVAEAPELTHRFIREKGKPWTLIAFHAHGRRVALWRSTTPVDCVGRLFLSPDRRTLVAEITLSKKFFSDEAQTRRVVALRLPRAVRP